MASLDQAQAWKPDALVTIFPCPFKSQGLKFPEAKGLFNLHVHVHVCVLLGGN